ncbi:uncharacterized protein LOC124539093 [Vanessa cardui]|uniref:uncharacterized protein LOC124539093 n=1 Tax=Vanessa cardui TaxID=171605 RepID=UPI001F133661|nr:uncharacterized protein LOC124539093 [Vanessa cardui]
MDEVMAAVKGMKNGKALGPDDIPVEVWKMLKGERCICKSMLFADDIVLVDEDGPEIQIRLEDWQRKLENVGLKISKTKIEYMFCDFGGLSKAIALDGAALLVRSAFKLREQLTRTCDPQIPLKLKGKIYKSMIRPAVLYGSECWTTKGMTKRQLLVAEMRVLRGMHGVTRIDRT